MCNIVQLWPIFLMTILCNISVLTFGLQTTWLATLQPALQSNSSPVGIPPLSDNEISWVGSLPSITLTVCAPFFGWTMDRFGRRTSLLIATAPNIISYLLLIFAQDVNFLYASRLIGGFCSCGAFVVGPIYIAECAKPQFKGPLSGITGFFVKLGMILSFLLGPFVSYNTLNIFSSSFTIIFMCLYFWMPESPAFLLKNGNYKQAESTLKKLWGKEDDELIRSELRTITNSLSESEPSTIEILKKFVMDKRLRVACIICGLIFSFQMLSGYPAIVRYTVDIISDAGVDFSPYLAAITLAISQLIFSFTGAFLLNRFGRKKLAVTCLACMASCMTILSTFLVLKSHYPDNNIILKLSPLPVVALVSFIGFYGAGYGTVPFATIPILFSSENRGTASTVLNIWFAFVEFIVVKTFYSIRNWLDLAGSLGIFAVFGFLGTGLLHKVMFKMEGLDFETIQLKLAGEKVPLKVSQAEKTLLPMAKTRQHC